MPDHLTTTPPPSTAPPPAQAASAGNDAAPLPPPPPGLQPAPPQRQTAPTSAPQTVWTWAAPIVATAFFIAGIFGVPFGPWLQGALTLLGIAGFIWLATINGRRLRAEKIASAEAWADALARTETARSGKPSGAPANPWDLTAGGGSQADPNLPAPFVARSARVTRASVFRATVGALRNPYSYGPLAGFALFIVVCGGFGGAVNASSAASPVTLMVAALGGAGYALLGVSAFIAFILTLTIPLTVYSRSAGGFTTVSLHTDGVRERTPERALLLPWANLTGLRDISGDIHFWTSGGAIIVAPRDAFTCDADRAAFLEQAVRLWRSRGGDWR